MKIQVRQFSEDVLALVRDFRSSALMTWLIVLILTDMTAVTTDLITTLLKEINPDLPHWLLW